MNAFMQFISISPSRGASSSTTESISRAPLALRHSFCHYRNSLSQPWAARAYNSPFQDRTAEFSAARYIYGICRYLALVILFKTRRWDISDECPCLEDRHATILLLPSTNFSDAQIDAWLFIAASMAYNTMPKLRMLDTQRYLNFISEILPNSSDFVSVSD